MKKPFKVISGLCIIFINGPIWWYLLHWLLIQSHATDLQMFLFWVYVPIAVFIGIVATIASASGDD